VGKKAQGMCGLAKFDICEEPEDMERDAGLCEEHFQGWVNSKEWREAVQDDGVRFAMSLSKKMGMREMNKFKRKWMKRIASTPETEE